MTLGSATIRRQRSCLACSGRPSSRRFSVLEPASGLPWVARVRLAADIGLAAQQRQQDAAAVESDGDLAVEKVLKIDRGLSTLRRHGFLLFFSFI